MKQPDEILKAETFIREHTSIKNQVNDLLEIVGAQLDLLQEYPKTPDPDANEKLIEWKIHLKDIVNQFSGVLRAHVERELVFLETATSEKIDKSDILKDEEVTEHLDELAWLLDNTPVRQVPVFTGYFKEKLEELRQGIIEHCQQGDRILNLVENIPEAR